MKKGYFLFFSSLIAGAVIIGTTFTIIIANNSNTPKDVSNNSGSSTEITTAIEDLKKEIKDLQERVSSLETDNKALNDEINKLKTASNSKTTSTKTIVKEKVVDNSKVDELESKLKSANNKISELEDKQNSNNSSKDDNPKSITLPERIVISSYTDLGASFPYYFELSPSGINANVIGFNKSVTRNEGSELSFNYTIFPEDSRQNANVIWKSSDPSIASVDNNGKVLTNKPGNCSITVKTTNGLEDTIYITVRDYSISAELLDNNGEYIYNFHPNQTGTIQISDNTPKKDFGPFTYISSNTNIATVDSNGNVKAIAVGDCEITIKGQENMSTTLDIHVYEEE